MIKKYFIIPFFILCSSLTIISQTVDDYLNQGIKYHDDGMYNEALDSYFSGLEIEPDNSVLLYEVSLSYFHMGEYEKAIEYADIVIEADDRNSLLAYINKGSCLDLMGRLDESIELFEEAIDKYGNYYLLNFNLAVNYYNIQDYAKTEELLIKGLQNNIYHPSSHMLLANTMLSTGRDMEAMLSLYYFLRLETGTQRVVDAYYQLVSFFEPEDEEMTITVDNVESPNLGIELGLKSAIILNQEKDLTEMEEIIDYSNLLFKVWSEIDLVDSNPVKDFYIDFFELLADSDQLETYCHYIRFTAVEESYNWLMDNREKLNQFSQWLTDNEGTILNPGE